MRTPTLSVNTCVYTHTHTHSCVCILHAAHTHRECLPFSSPLLPLFASPAVIDVLSHSVQDKLRHHGYSSRDVLSPGDGQYWNNNSLNNTTNQALKFKGNYWKLAALQNPGRCACSASSWPMSLPRAGSGVSLGKKPLRHGREPCGSGTWGSGNILAENQLSQQRELASLLVYHQAASASLGLAPGITPRYYQ